MNIFFSRPIKLIIGLLLISLSVAAQKLVFTVSMERAAAHYFHVDLKCENMKGTASDFKMPAWSPGYYQLLNYAANVENFRATDTNNKELTWEKTGHNTWSIQNNPSSFLISYDVKATRAFVASPYVDEERGYIVPAGVFVYPAGQLQLPVKVIVKPYASWRNVVTGLDSVAGSPFTYTAPDFDILYDCPLLAGNLDELPSFNVKGIPHRFVGYKLGNFDHALFMQDLKKIVEAASGIIGDIPYRHYTFIGIGPGAGGIEHLNSTTISFSGIGSDKQARLRTLNFIAHEYFHHYNVKRIRPIELGPFDYDKGSRTNMLWVSEGLTVYYEYLAVKRAGLSAEEDIFRAFQSNINAYESKPGRLFQSLTQASFATWSDGPFGRTGDEVNKTISYYDKGPAVGLLLDFLIRHETKNKKSLDDVMRTLYRQYYQQQKRGFTEDEFRAVCEKTAGKPLPEFFEYVSTTKEIDYPKYFAYAGLDINVTPATVPGGWSGISTRARNDSLVVSTVDWESPAWNAGIRARNIILAVNGQPAGNLSAVLKDKNPGDAIEFTFLQDGQKKTQTIVLGKKTERSFAIKRMPNPDPLQSAILKSWLGE
jgi:predicted metalloprotease with PDZ domain